MGIDALVLIALMGAAAGWAALAAPELPEACRAVASLAGRLVRVERVRAELTQADLRWISPWRWLALRLGVAAAAGVAAWLAYGLVVVGLVAALAAYHLVALALESRRRRVEAERQRALLDAVHFGVSVISRSGSALQMVRALAEGGPVDAQPIFRELLADAGSDLPGLLVGAVQRMRARLADPLFDDVALALTLHWSRGGRLAPVLEAVAASWDETLRLQREAKALRAGMEASVALLTVLPFVFLLL